MNPKLNLRIFIQSMITVQYLYVGGEGARGREGEGGGGYTLIDSGSYLV